jgi:hypothetical protein
MNDAALWAWFLFGSGLPTQRAKTLLGTWHAQSLTLRAALARTPSCAAALGLSPTEAARLSPPEALPELQALTWDASLYPAGLNRLPMKLRPALLYYRGEPTLLLRPIITLAPGSLDEVGQDHLREVINLLLGEELLLAAYEDSDQATLLMEEMTYSQGETLLFANAGLEARDPSGAESQLLADGRALVLSPLPPTASHRPAWAGILTQVALAAADRIILSGESAQQLRTVAGLGTTPTLALSDAPPDLRDPAALVPQDQTPANIRVTDTPADVLLWIEGLFPEQELPESTTGRTTATDNVSAHALSEEDLGPAPSTEEILTTLGKGGTIPEALRRRLVGEA